MSKLVLSKELYSHKFLQKCCEDFKCYAEINVIDEMVCWIVEFSNCRLGEAETISEFENYLIELTYGSMDG